MKSVIKTLASEGDTQISADIKVILIYEVTIKQYFLLQHKH